MKEKFKKIRPGDDNNDDNDDDDDDNDDSSGKYDDCLRIGCSGSLLPPEAARHHQSHPEPFLIIIMNHIL